MQDDFIASHLLPSVDAPFLSAHHDNLMGVRDSLNGVIRRLDYLAQLTLYIPELQKTGDAEMFGRHINVLLEQLTRTQLLHAFRIAKETLVAANIMPDATEWYRTLDASYGMLVYASLHGQERTMAFFHLGYLSPQDWELLRRLGLEKIDRAAQPASEPMQGAGVLVASKQQSLRQGEDVATFLSSVVATVSSMFASAAAGMTIALQFTETLEAMHRQGHTWMGPKEEHVLRDPVARLFRPNTPLHPHAPSYLDHLAVVEAFEATLLKDQQLEFLSFSPFYRNAGFTLPVSRSVSSTPIGLHQAASHVHQAIHRAALRGQGGVLLS